MQKVKTFFHVFQNSLLPQASYYHKLVKIRFSFSFKYFVILICTVNLLFAVFVLVKLNVLGVFSIKNSLLTTLREYPKELSITVQNGVLRSNYNRPYFIWLTVDEKKRLLAVVDESATAEDGKVYTSPVLFTAKSLAIQSTGGTIEVPYGNREIVINKSVVEKAVNKLSNLFSWGIPFLFIFFIAVVPLLFSLMYLLYFLIVSIIVFALFKLFLHKVRLKKTVQLSLHAGTTPILIDYSLCLLKPQVATSLFTHTVFFALALIFVFSAVYEGYLDPVTRTHHHHR